MGGEHKASLPDRYGMIWPSCSGPKQRGIAKIAKVLPGATWHRLLHCGLQGHKEKRDSVTVYMGRCTRGLWDGEPHCRPVRPPQCAQVLPHTQGKLQKVKSPHESTDSS
mmetsp:Transcript_7977/g.17780  ORF Transcript_7977/g.17780 Transcript_7977/m.17780 type:complete len:109 (-) Transcript_7977:1237-1563(-)